MERKLPAYEREEAYERKPQISRNSRNSNGQFWEDVNFVGGIIGMVQVIVLHMRKVIIIVDVSINPDQECVLRNSTVQTMRMKL